MGTGGGLACVIAIGALVATTILLPRVLDSARLQGHGVHPALVLVALSVGALVAGILGLVLAVPVVVALREIGPAVINALNGRPGEALHVGLVPRWFDQIAQWSWRLLVLAAVVGLSIAVLGQIPLIVIPLVLASVAAATMASGVGALRRRGLTPTTAALALTIGGFGLILVILVLTLTALVQPIGDMISTGKVGADKVDDALASGESVASVLAAFGPAIASAVADVVRGLAGLGISVVLGAILTFFLLRDGAAGFEVATRQLVPWRRDELEAAARRATTVLGNYMIGTGAISAVGAASQFLIMAILGLPLAWPLAVLSFLGGFIPYIGSVLTTGLAFLVTVAVGSPQDILIMLIFTLVFNIVQGNIVAPLVYGRAVSIHPGRRPAGDPGRRGRRRDRGDVPRRAHRRRGGHDVADRPAGLRERPARPGRSGRSGARATRAGGRAHGLIRTSGARVARHHPTPVTGPATAPGTRSATLADMTADGASGGLEGTDWRLTRGVADRRRPADHRALRGRHAVRAGAGQSVSRDLHARRRATADRPGGDDDDGRAGAGDDRRGGVPSPARGRARLRPW